MGTKWKSRVAVITWTLLFTIGLSGILTVLFEGGNYFKPDYFQTYEFQSTRDQFIRYLNVFELNGITKEDAKKAITVTKEDINEHRYLYGDLDTQITTIKNQYDDKIQNALVTGNKEVANTYTAERDKKIEDITNNFKSDDYVRLKIIKEKEQKIDAYYNEMENYRSAFLKDKESFKYYLKDTVTGQVYTNITLATGQTMEQVINNEKMIYTMTYPSSHQGSLSTKDYEFGLSSETDIDEIFTKKVKTFNGRIGVAKSTNPIVTGYQNFQQKQIFFYIFAGSAVILFLLSLILARKTKVLTYFTNEKWRPYYNRIPIDVRLMLFAFFAIFTCMFLLFMSSKQISNFNRIWLYNTIQYFILTYLGATSLVILTFIQGRFLLDRLKDVQALKADWQKAVIFRVFKGIKEGFKGIKEAFMDRSFGTQVVILLGIVFALGAGFLLIIVQPKFLLLYIPFVAFIGIPILSRIIKHIGYFNRIMDNSNQLTRGNFEPDLPVIGKSVLSTLAANINTIKHGVKTSQHERAKSERLKTELITNVSHDLRTPLTSIISYTELLKTPNLTAEDREAYLEIIDRKSKRLKVLIDDLFEASKMASGSIELDKEKVDLVQLLQQALAEHNETIKKSTLQFRVKNPETPVYAIVDGQKLWRVFDNLIGNILKYSLENTRVFISVKKLEDKAVIVFKNVTKYELSEEIDELFERFKRGDTSRHTEGSGLGLAIAKSIVDLHDGTLDIEVDGDLFKVIVTLEARGE